MSPKVSVIISTYNRPETLKRAIDSVAAQTFKDWELFVIHDGLDGPNPIEAHPNVYDHHRNINFINIEHFGNHSRPKNEGIKLAMGEYIAFLDDDNAYRPDHLAVLVQELDKHSELTGVYSDRWVVAPEKEKCGLGVYSEFSPTTLLERNYIDTSDMLIKRSALLEVGGWDERYKRFLDWNLWLRLTKAGHKFKRVPLILTDYYVHNDMLSLQVENKTDPNKPMWDPYDCEITLPFLGPISEPKIAVFTITYDRLDYTQQAFESLRKTAGWTFDHYVVDNGSKDKTPQWLKKEHKGGRLKKIILNPVNKGISIASNQAIDSIGPHNYDIIVKFDNDCMCLTQGWLAKMVDIWKSNRLIALSCYVQGLRDNPGGAPRLTYGLIKDELVGMTKHLGGICHFVDASAYRDYRWPEDEQLHGMQDLEFSNYLLFRGFQMGYLESYFVSHGPAGTLAQTTDYPVYFERRKQEKVERYERSYEEIQRGESALSRGTRWGERIKDSIERYKDYLQGKVLDIGCGDGYGLEVMQKMGIKAEGIDLSFEKVDIAKKEGYRAHTGYMEELPFPDKSFGTVFCSHTLEHAKDLNRAVSEIKRVASRAVIIVPLSDLNNPAHTSIFKSGEEVKHLFGGKVVFEEEPNRIQPEYSLVVDI